MRPVTEFSEETTNPFAPNNLGEQSKVVDFHRHTRSFVFQAVTVAWSRRATDALRLPLLDLQIAPHASAVHIVPFAGVGIHLSFSAFLGLF